MSGRIGDRFDQTRGSARKSRRRLSGELFRIRSEERAVKVQNKLTQLQGALTRLEHEAIMRTQNLQHLVKVITSWYPKAPQN
jgi:hypothetical protein